MKASISFLKVLHGFEKLFLNPKTLLGCNFSKKKNHKLRNRFDLPNSDTSRRWTINFRIGLLPSKPGVHDTLTARCLEICTFSALTFVGANGNSMTPKCADRVSLPPGDVTMQKYSPTSEARTAWISSVPSALTPMRWLLPMGWTLLARNQSMLKGTLGSLETLHCSEAVWPSRTTVSAGGWMMCVRTVGEKSLNQTRIGSQVEDDTSINATQKHFDTYPARLERLLLAQSRLHWSECMRTDRRLGREHLISKDHPIQGSVLYWIAPRWWCLRLLI